MPSDFAGKVSRSVGELWLAFLAQYSDQCNQLFLGAAPTSVTITATDWDGVQGFQVSVLGPDDAETDWFYALEGWPTGDTVPLQCVVGSAGWFTDGAHELTKNSDIITPEYGYARFSDFYVEMRKKLYETLCGADVTVSGTSFDVVHPESSFQATAFLKVSAGDQVFGEALQLLMCKAKYLGDDIGVDYICTGASNKTPSVALPGATSDPAILEALQDIALIDFDISLNNNAAVASVRGKVRAE